MERIESAFRATLRRDLLIALRRPGEIANPLVFFVIVIALFPLGIGPTPTDLARIAPGVLWVVALLASLLSTDMVFRSDHDDGSLEQLLRSPDPLYLLVIAKIGVHWLVTGLPLTLLSPVMAAMLYMPPAALPALLLSLLAGTLTLSLVGGIGAALTVGLRKGGILLALLILPFYVPVLVFGTAAVDAAATGADYLPQLAILGALALLALTLAPLAVAAALRISLDH
ncbi:MAG: heme exporter protein CcmB [Pseudomonadales bacterium]|nr:heme exporter protein CcmB [Pseudomonadales bacterium]MCP5320387.1 heme exporter protein CcmB [Pseudomonadales bacterium]